MKNIGVFGGSFNPVHSGHVALVKKMKEEFSLDKVIIIPTRVTPLKDNTPMVSPYHRLTMTKLAFSDLDYVTVSDIEIRREGKSYTVDTLRNLYEIYQGDRLHLILGADSFIQLPQWKNTEEIFRIAKILTIARDSFDYEILTQKASEYECLYNAQCAILETPVLDISSTMVRTLIKNGESAEKFLPSVVSEYIKEQGFYG